MSDAPHSQSPARTTRLAWIADLVALTKPRITFMVLVTTLGGLFLAPSRPGLGTILFALLGTALVVGSANTLNCWIERDVDKHMTRTKNRPLPAGRLSAAGIVLFAILFLWQLPHFLAIAMFREAEYTRAGIKVVPALRGPDATRWQAIAWAIALVPVSLLLGPLGIAGALYTSVALVSGALFLWYCVKSFRAYAAENVNEPSTPARPSPEAIWGRKVFVASLLYLPALFAGLAIDVAIG